MGLLATIKRETHYIGGLLRMLRSVKDVDAESNRLLADELERRVDSFGQNIAFIEDDRQWTYDDFENYANKVAGWAQDQGLKAGDTVVIPLHISHRVEVTSDTPCKVILERKAA